MSNSGAADVAVVDEPGRSRFEVRVGGELAGFAEYERRPSVIAFMHTVVDPAFEGRGLGGRLVRTALDETRAAGLAVLPFCPFVRGYIARHEDEYLDLVPATQRDAFDLPEHSPDRRGAQSSPGPAKRSETPDNRRDSAEH